MFCSNCGAQFSDDAKVCPVCGKVVESAEESGVSTVSTPPVSPKKPKKFLPFIAIGAGVLLVSVLLVIGFWNHLSNTFAKTFLSAEDYYTYVEKSNVENTVSEFYDFFGLGSSSQKELKDGYSGSMKVEVGDAMKELYSIYGIEERLEWLEEVELAFDSNMSAEAMDTNMTVKLNGTSLASAQMLMDMKEGTMYATAPDLISKYLRMPMFMALSMGGATEIAPDVTETPYMVEQAVPGEGNTVSGILSGAFSDMDELKEIIDSIKKAMPSEKVATQLAVKYFELITDSIENAEKDSVKLEIKGVTQSCTRVTVELDGKMILNAMNAVLKEAKTDKQIKKIICDIAESVEEDPDDVYEAFREAVEDALDALEDIDADDIDDLLTDEIVFTNWVSSSGEIVAREIEIGEMVIKLASIEQGSKTACEYSLESNDVCLLEFKGSGKKSKGLYDGKYTLTVRDMEVLEIEVEDYDKKTYEKDGYLNGTFYFDYGDDIVPDTMFPISGELLSLAEELRLGIEVKSNEKSVSLATMVLNDKTPYLTFTISADKHEYSEPSIPSDDKCIDLSALVTGKADEETMVALQELLVELKNYDIFTKLEDAGVPNDLLDEMKNGMGSIDEAG